jgi:transposase InsO family protein
MHPIKGTEKTKLRARTPVYWRSINRDIVETKSCVTRQELQNSQTKEHLNPTETPSRAWHTVGTDLFQLDGSDYLLVADYYSKYNFVRKIPKGQSNSKTVVTLMKQIFSEQGIPKVVRSDNSPQYDGQAFRDFAKEYGFRHITSSPHFPQSNGFIESQVKTIKNTLNTTVQDRPLFSSAVSENHTHR